MATKDIGKTLALPLILLIVLISLIALWKLLKLPPEEELIALVQKYFDLYGYWVVLVSAILETLLLVGWYFPGGFIIFLGVLFASANISRVAGVVTLVIIGSLLALSLNYLLGKYGWYKLFLKLGLRGPLEKAQIRFIRYGLPAVLGSYWNPNLASLTATAAGILHFPFRKFFTASLLATVVWDVFWGTLVYLLGERALVFTGLRFALLIVGVWILLAVIKYAISKYYAQKFSYR